MASAVPPPVGLSSPADMVAYPPADSLISVRGAASSALRCDDKGDPDETHGVATDHPAARTRGSSASTSDAQLCNVREAQEQQGTPNQARGRTRGTFVAALDAKMHELETRSRERINAPASGEGVTASADRGYPIENALDDSDEDHWLSPTARQGSDGGYSDFDWDDAQPTEDLSASIRGVHATAVDVIRRSLSLLESPEFFAGRRGSMAENEEDDDDGMEEEELSLSKKAAKLRQSLTDVSVEDITIEKGNGAQIVSQIEPDGEEMRKRIDDPSQNGEEGVRERGAGVGIGGNGLNPNALLPVEERDGGHEECSPSSAGAGGRAGSSKSDDSGKLVLRPVARRPLKEMLRLDATVEVQGMEPVVRLEHLQSFMEKWAPEALTPTILSQVFGGMVPIASRQGQREPVCTYMMECCVRPEVEAVSMLHIVSLVASEHGLELVRKRGAQVLYGVAPPEANLPPGERSVGAPGHVRRKTWSTASPSSAAGREPMTPPGRSDKGRQSVPANFAEAVNASPSPCTAVPLTSTPVFEDDPPPGTSAARSMSTETGGDDDSSCGDGAAAGVGSSAGKGEEEGGTGGVPELRGWKGAGGAGWGPWSHVDMQLVIGQASKHRVLLIRFVTARPASCREALRLAASAAENGQPLAIAPAAQGFVSSVKVALRDRGVLLAGLEGTPPKRTPVELDPQFLGQMEAMCQWDMVASLREAGVSLDEHARNEELRGVVVTRLLEEMFTICQLPMLPPPPQLVLAMPRANDILPSSVETMPELSWEDEQELREHRFASEASRIMATVLARCIRFTERCDEQMTARMQRKNRQVMERISRSQLYQRELFQALRDAQVAVQQTRMATAFHKIVSRRVELGIDPAIETPIYYCSVIAGRRPGYLYLTYWHMVLVTRLPGFSPQVVVMAMEDVDAVERIKFFVGYGIQVKRRSSPHSPPPRISPLPPSPASSSPPGPPASGGCAGGAPAIDGYGLYSQAAAGATAARRARPPVILFSTTSVSTGELRELLIALVRVHREPVTSPRTPTRSNRRGGRAGAAGREGGSSAAGNRRRSREVT